MFDPDGFLKITDRLSRFSKIAGEMVPHVGVESAILQATGADENQVAVTAIADSKHGERLCVLHTPLSNSPMKSTRRSWPPRFPGYGFRRYATSFPSRKFPSRGPAKSTSGAFGKSPRRNGAGNT